MDLIEINGYIPRIAKAPHKIYVLELTLEELRLFKLSALKMLRSCEEFQAIDEKTNIFIVGLDGDKGLYSHSNVSKTHGVISDFRPLAIHIVFWNKPDNGLPITSLDYPKIPVKTTRK